MNLREQFTGPFCQPSPIFLLPSVFGEAIWAVYTVAGERRQLL